MNTTDLPIYDREALAAELMAIGFSCTRCGACCRGDGADDGTVMIGAEETRGLVAASGRSWDEVAAPYPAWTRGPEGAIVTVNWRIRHEADRCIFLSPGGCTVYAARPWICRTYPFMLGDEGLVVSKCPGLGSPLPREEALELAGALIERRRAEDREAEVMAGHLERCRRLPRGSLVIDTEGVKQVHG
jgi:Fe-S-cluster containining protein